MSTTLLEENAKKYQAIADRIRLSSLKSTTIAGSGHPTSCLSCADILAVLFFHSLRYDPDKPQHPSNDRFILSKGHAAPALWAMFNELGMISDEQLESLRTVGSDVEGHPTPRNPYIDVPTGSLGQGLSMGLGMSLWSQLHKIDNRIWVLLGDGECAEGAVWEAAMLASHYKAKNLCAIIDVNGLGQTGQTMYGSSCQAYKERFEAFGWKSILVDGHNAWALANVFDCIQESDQPCAIIAETVKGRGVSFLEDAPGMHGQTISQSQLRIAENEIYTTKPKDLSLSKPEVKATGLPKVYTSTIATYDLGDEIATRHAYGSALLTMMQQDERLMAFDAEVSNSTGTAGIKKNFPNRFVECFIAEQNMLGMALGAAALGAIPCVSTFSAFLTRAADQLRMAGLSGHHLIVAGSHSGISIGEDGPSQMGLEDLALFRSINSSTVLCPADGVSTHYLLSESIHSSGLIYIRLFRPSRQLIYEKDDRNFRIGGSRVLKSSPHDKLCIIACGICVHEALAAAEQLEDIGYMVKVIDAYSIKPLDIDTILDACDHTGRIICVEDHYRTGGLGEAVASQILPHLKKPIQFKHLAVDGTPCSGSEESLMRRHEIDADAILKTAHSMLP